MKIILCGGGTSGHVNPALAIAEKIKAKHKDAKFLFIGREGGFENRAVKKAGIPLITVKIEGISRSLTLKNINRFKLALKAKSEAEKIIKDFSPNVAVGTGGYVCWPVIKAAQSLKIPTLIHESNVCPGLVTKLLCPGCDLVLLNYEETRKYLRKNISTEIVGNPLRADFTKTPRNEARKALGLSDKDVFILSFGGSGGAKKLNDILTSLMSNSFKITPGIVHLHATGNKYFRDYKHINNTDSRCKIVPFIDDMPKVLSAADIVIARSGSGTISELALVGAASILIPSPNVTNNHQYKNAKLLYDAGATVMIEESELSEELLRSKAEQLYKDKELRFEMGKRIKFFADPTSAERAAKTVVSFCSK